MRERQFLSKITTRTWLNTSHPPTPNTRVQHTYVGREDDVGIAGRHVGPGHKSQLHLIRTRQDGLGHPPGELGVVALDLRTQDLRYHGAQLDSWVST